MVLENNVPRFTDQIRAILDQMDAQAGVLTAAPDEPALAAKWVRIRPPFPRGAKYRDYPDPRFVPNFEGKPIDTITGYASSIQGPAWNCNYFDYRSQGGVLMLMGDNPFVRQGPSGYPQAIDQLAFPHDYRDPKIAVPEVTPNSANDPWISHPTPPSPTGETPL